MLRDYRAHIRFCHDILSLLKLGGYQRPTAPPPSVSTNAADNSSSSTTSTSAATSSEEPNVEKTLSSESLFTAQVDVMLRIINAHILIGDLKGVKDVVEECVQLAQVRNNGLLAVF